MKSKSFLSTFIRYSFSAVFFLWITYLLADMHINKIPGFSLEEGFIIAGEFLVYFAFILAMKDTKKTQSELFFEAMSDSMESFAKSVHEYAETEKQKVQDACVGHDERYSSKTAPVHIKKSISDDKIPDWLKVPKKTTKGIPLSAEHKKKISESLKKKNAEKKRMLFKPAVTAKTVKSKK